MGCCGDRRQAQNLEIHRAGFVRYKYSGSGMLNVVGGITGIQYHFDGAGSVQDVDIRDISNVRKIPGLLRVE